MEYTTLGTTGLEVSRLCLGCANFGTEAEWQVGDRETSIGIIDRAIDSGINFLDTANVYANGESESIVGEAIEGRRDELVIATKVHGRMRDGPNGQGLSRKHVLEQVEASLDRLGTDYIDLYQLHRWDENTPIEETLSALDHLIQEGKVRYIGASTMAGWQFATALYESDLRDLERFVCMQPEYSLVRRHEEVNMLPVARGEGLGVIPWSPLAAGFLSGEYERGDDEETLAAADRSWRDMGMYDCEENWAVLDVVREVADAKDATPAQVSLSWLLHEDVVTAPIIGPQSIEHVEENVGALDVSLSDDEIERLEAPIDPVWSPEIA